MRRFTTTFVLIPAVLGAQTSQPTQSASPRPTIAFDEYDPRSMLKVPEHKPTRSKFPFISVHEHPRIDMPGEQVDALVRRMDALNMRVAVNLSGRQGEMLAKGVRNYTTRHPGRFVVFANVDFRGIDAPDWGERQQPSWSVTSRKEGPKVSRSSRTSEWKCGMQRGNASRSTIRGSIPSGEKRAS